jgi:predicted ATPase/DNA-binding winged helix-turn-helix (wHTH) protein
MSERAISFGPFLLLAEQRLLFEGDRSVRLGNRAFDILVLLIERAGEVVGKEELIARVWPQTFVEEANLKLQVSALRRALGDGQGGNRYIVTVVGRGYNFVAPIRFQEPPWTRPPATPPTAKHNLPLAVTRIIGREQAVEALISRLPRQRLVTVIGPGGIGKTTVALTVAERMVGEYEHGVWLVDLASLGDARLAPSAVGAVLGLQIHGEDPIRSLVAALRDTRMLLVLDNCEHVIDEVASLARALLSGTKDVAILATSRQPLRVTPESEYRLGPLASPQGLSKLTAAEAATFPVVQLFVERAAAIVQDFTLTDANAVLVGEICRRLDGLPLAIEFAAPRIGVLGIAGLAARLGDSLPLLGTRRRTATSRHRTMRAVIDWSYDLLNREEQLFFQALGVFSGGFTVEGAAAVAMDSASVGIETIDRLADLIEKSLVAADVSGVKPWFRLLDTTRAYAVEKLASSGNREGIARRHAEYYRDLFERAESESAARPTSEWLADYAREINNLRAALEWALRPGGDDSIGVALTVAAIPLWLQLSMMEECRSRVEQALTLLREAPIDASGEMKLQAALGASLLFTKGAVPAAGQACTAALRLAESLGDTEYQLNALWETWIYRTNTGGHAAALAIAQKFHTLALEHADAAVLPIADRMIGMSYHYLGDQTNARPHIERMLSADVDPQRRSPIMRFWFDQKVAGRIVLARILWLRGFADQAWLIVQSAIRDAEALNDPATLCYALSHGGCLVALWLGNLAAAEHYAETLLDISRKHGFAPWNDFASRLKGVVLVKSGDLDGGSPLLRADFCEITDSNSGLWFLTALSQMAEALGRAGRFVEALETVERGIERSQRGWLAPELLRLKGELLLLQGAAGITEAMEDVFRLALDEARRQEALSWELRAATSLARLLSHQGRAADAFAYLQPIYGRFTEGFGTADLIAAKQLLDDLGDHYGGRSGCLPVKGAEKRPADSGRAHNDVPKPT